MQLVQMICLVMSHKAIPPNKQAVQLLSSHSVVRIITG
jgi:hypothetical protein